MEPTQVSRRATGFRRAQRGDTSRLTEIIAAAFRADPVWGSVFGLVALSGSPDESIETEQLFRSWWTLFVEGALPHGWVWMTTGGEAAAVWIPPGLAELDADQERRSEELIERLPVDTQAKLRNALGEFDSARPTEPCFYLSLLATHPDCRGKGLGMALLSHTLELVDSHDGAACLESTNPVNLGRYASVGFSRSGSFTVEGGHSVVTTMWRPARSAD